MRPHLGVTGGKDGRRVHGPQVRVGSPREVTPVLRKLLSPCCISPEVAALAVFQKGGGGKIAHEEPETFLAGAKLFPGARQRLRRSHSRLIGKASLLIQSVER